MISRTPFFNSWVCYPQPDGCATKSTSFLVSRWPYHFHAVPPHSNLSGQERDLPFLISAKIQKPFARGSPGDLSCVTEQKWVTCSCPNQTLGRKWDHWGGLRWEDPSPTSGMGPEEVGGVNRLGLYWERERREWGLGRQPAVGTRNTTFQWNRHRKQGDRQHLKCVIWVILPCFCSRQSGLGSSFWSWNFTWKVTDENHPPRLGGGRKCSREREGGDTASSKNQRELGTQGTVSKEASDRVGWHQVFQATGLGFYSKSVENHKSWGGGFFWLSLFFSEILFI